MEKFMIPISTWISWNFVTKLYIINIFAQTQGVMGGGKLGKKGQNEDDGR